MKKFIGYRLAAASLASALLGACASAPPVQSIATVAVQATVTPEDLVAAHSQAVRVRQALLAAGISRNEVEAGRVVRVACAMMTDGTWGAVGLLPTGARAANDSVWRMRILDVGDNDRDALNPLVEPVPERKWSGKAAYVFDPKWREKGRSTNIDRVPLPKGEVDHYHVVFSRYLVRCRD